MIYRKKVPPADVDLSAMLLKNGWRKIKTPKNLFIAVMLSIPFMAMNFALTMLLVPSIRAFLAELLEQFEISGLVFAVDITLIAYIFAIFGFLVAHELLHAVFIPNFIKSRKTFWGITPYGGFVTTAEEMSKSRFILISILPFVVLSIIVPTVLYQVSLFGGFIVFLSVLNALSSAVDMLNALLIIIQVPNGSRIVPSLSLFSPPTASHSRR